MQLYSYYYMSMFISSQLIFHVIATNGCYPLRSHSIHRNAANCMMIHLRYIGLPGGEGYASAHVHIIPLPVVKFPCGVRRLLTRF